MPQEEPAESREPHPQPPSTPDAADAEMLRTRLVDELRRSGTITDFEVERAMRSVPRHHFLPASSLAEAYADAAVATHFEDGVAVSSASQPAIVALMLQQLRLAPGMRVLEIGAGTGYNAALLAALVAPTGSVTSVDIDPAIVAEAREHLTAAHALPVTLHVGDGRNGWPDSAPYDRILLTVGADDIWPAWQDQLAEDGLLVLPLELANGQASIAFRRHGNVLTSESITPCGFMRLRGGEATASSLVPLPDERRLASNHADEIADSVSTLLQTRPHFVLARRLDAATLQRLGFSLALMSDLQSSTPSEDPTAADTTGRVVMLLPRNFNGRGRRIRHGVYATDANGPSLALFASRLPLLLVFGGKAAERLIENALGPDAPAYPPIEQWRIEARPRAEAESRPTPADALRLTRQHVILDVWPNG